MKEKKKENSTESISYGNNFVPSGFMGPLEKESMSGPEEPHLTEEAH